MSTACVYLNMDISQSIFGLAKSNNGFFKSDNQGIFLISQLKEFGGCFAQANSGYNSCSILWDQKGITKIIKSAKNADIVMFERKECGVLTSLESKEIKSLERKIKSIEKEICEIQTSFEDGSYNGSGDINTYTAVMIDRYNHFQGQKKELIKVLKVKLVTLQAS
jgi:hypothetical protein